MDFSDKTVVVTGASEGIGRAVALAMAQQGADLVLAARNESRLLQVQAQIQALGRRAVAVRCDVIRDDDVARLAAEAVAAFGQVDILVNNAGVAVRGALEDMTLADWQFILDTNLLGYVRCIHAFVPQMLARNSGHIVNVSSIQGIFGTTDVLNIPYITSKAAIFGLSEALFSYLRPRGIGVTVLCPGAIATSMGTNAQFVGSAEAVAAMRRTEAEFFKQPFFLKPEVLADGLIQGMRDDRFLILIPDHLEDRLSIMGRNVKEYNQYFKTALEKNTFNPKDF